MKHLTPISERSYRSLSYESRVGFVPVAREQHHSPNPVEPEFVIFRRQCRVVLIFLLFVIAFECFYLAALRTENTVSNSPEPAIAPSSFVLSG